jgi:hypothetical protein
VTLTQVTKATTAVTAKIPEPNIFMAVPLPTILIALFPVFANR